MPPADLLRWLVLAQILRGEIKEVDDQRRKQITEAGMDAGDRLGVRVPGPSGEPVKVGVVRVDPAPTTVEVTDERALLEWVREHYPGEITETVRESFLARLKKHAKKAEEPVTEEGEVIPGLEVSRGEPRPVVTTETGAAGVVAEAFRRGELPELLAVVGQLPEE